MLDSIHKFSAEPTSNFALETFLSFDSGLEKMLEPLFSNTDLIKAGECPKARALAMVDPVDVPAKN